MPAQDLAEFVSRNRDKVAALFERYKNSGKNLFLRSDLWDEYKVYCSECEGDGFLESSSWALSTLRWNS